MKKSSMILIILNYGIENNDFMKFYEKCDAGPYSFLPNDTTLPLYNL